MKKHKPNFITNNNTHVLLYLFLAWSLAVTQPLMSVFGKQPVFLIAHDVRAWLFVGLTLVFNFIPPLAVWLVAGLLGLVSRHLKELLIRLVLAFLLFLFMVQMVVALPLIYAFFTAVFLAILAVYLLVKLNLVRTFAQWFSVAGLLFVFSFLFIAPSKQLLPSFKSVSNDIKAATDNPVFVIILDEFPLLALLKNNMEIDESRFPVFAELAKQSTWYANATAVSSATELALPAILNGIKPSLKEARSGTYEQYPYNIFTQFSNSHKIHAVENSTRMCPSHLCQSVVEKPFQLLWEDMYISYLYIIYPKDTRHKLPPVNDRWIGFMREIKNQKRKDYDFSERLNKFKKFYSTFKKYPKNTLHFLHVLLPHVPWTILPNLDLYGFYEKDGVPGELDKTKNKTQYNHQWTNDSWATQLSWRRELLQIGAVDTLVGQMLQEIKKQGLYDDAMIVIVADHGAAFIPGLSRRYAHDENISDIARIPLFIKYPQQTAGKIDKGLASNLDIFPTLLDVFSIQTNEKLDGESLANDNRSKDIDMIQEKFAVTPLPVNHQQIFKKQIEEKNALFQQSGWQGVYHPLGTETFYGKDLQILQIQNRIPNAIKLWNANLYKIIKDDGKYKPAYYRLSSLIDDLKSKEILVSINGTLVSHCYMFVHAQQDCAGLIDPEVYTRFPDQALHLQFFSVKKYQSNTYTVDELLDINSTKAQIIAQNNQEFIQFDDGKINPIKNKGAPYGKASLYLKDNDTTYLIDGWTGDTVKDEPASKVLVFMDDKLFSMASTGIRKKYLFNRYGSRNLLDAGFQVMIPVEQFPDIQRHKVRVFATLDNHNWNELNYQISAQRELFKVFNNKNSRVIPLDVDAVLEGKLLLAGLDELPKVSVIDAFSKDFDLFSAGDWFPVAKRKRWMGAVAYIDLSSIERITEDLQLTIKAKPIIYKGVNTQQRMNVYLNGKLIDEESFIKKGDKTIFIDKKYLVKNKQNILKLEFPGALSPEKYGKGVDTRFLSLYVYGLKIMPLE